MKSQSHVALLADQYKHILTIFKYKNKLQISHEEVSKKKKNYD